MKNFLLASLMVTAISLIHLPVSHAQFENLVRHLPNKANTLVLFNMEQIMASPLATQQKWNENEQAKFAAGLIMVPPQALHLAIASQMDIELMHPRWQASVMDLSEEPDMLTVTERHGGNVDTISRQDAAVLPNNTYVVKFGKSIAGVMYPADRQQVAAWIDDVFSMSDRKPLTPYLLEAEAFADKKDVPIILAMDLKNLLSPQFIRHQLTQTKSLQGKKADLDQLAKALSSVRGVTLGIEISDHVTGGLKIDFDEDISASKDFAKALILETLGSHGLMINEFKDWQVQVGSKEMLLKGSLQSSGIQRVFSLFDMPPGFKPLPNSSASTSTDSKKPDPKLMAHATQQYFKSINLLINDLKHEDQQHQTTTPGLEAIWYAKYAAKIDALPILHVDPAMVTFATQVSGALRNSQNAMRSAGVKTASRMMNMPDAQIYNYKYAAGAEAHYGPYGGGVGGAYAYRYQYNPRASLRQDGEQLAQIQQQETSKGYASANNIMQEIAISTTEIRRKMTEKYQIEF
ncbi:hypothetical protein EC9_04800 [Rosistilla ulvae]|uniref:Uncharacterized protein n=1 Tax=Rosistilla ulvae TaxID=1930277 RepID=A0A517LUN5_9BACT|nr:hypothetical protein [Rosistilla ulvae]QDS86319.1 hypothetical protein EC9_04800 [Rosistilla ulvae]